MKKIYIIIIVLLIVASACKSRQVAISQTNLATTTDSLSIRKQTSFKVDSSRAHTDIKSSKFLADSSEVEILPDSGTMINILITPNGTFNYSGKAKKIVYRQQNTAKSIFEKNSQKTQVAGAKISISDSLVKTIRMNASVKTKAVEAKQNATWIFYLVGLITFFIIIGYIACKYIIKL